MNVNTRKKESLIEVLGGMIALLGMFLPYTPWLSFFQSLHGAPWLAPALTLAIAFTTVLYALGHKRIPYAMSLLLLLICTVFPGHACRAAGLKAVLSQLRLGAWLLFAGLWLMALSPLFHTKRKQTGH